jgi:hypothetical protein
MEGTGDAHHGARAHLLGLGAALVDGVALTRHDKLSGQL